MPARPLEEQILPSSIPPGGPRQRHGNIPPGVVITVRVQLCERLDHPRPFRLPIYLSRACAIRMPVQPPGGAPEPLPQRLRQLPNLPTRRSPMGRPPDDVAAIAAYIDSGGDATG